MRNDPNWENWDFAQLSEALRLWTRRNPMVAANDHNKQKYDRPRKVLFSNDRERVCVYCQGEDHKPSSCTKLTDVIQEEKFWQRKDASGNHPAANCPSKRASQKLQQKTSHVNLRFETKI